MEIKITIKQYMFYMPDYYDNLALNKMPGQRKN